MYTNADVTLYLYSREGRTEKYIRVPVMDVYWEDSRQSSYLKTGQKDAVSALLVIPWASLNEPLRLTEGRDLVVKGIITDEIDSTSQETLSKSLAALKAEHSALTVTMVDERLYGSEAAWHYELGCK